jgi:hypothetical protein
VLNRLGTELGLVVKIRGAQVTVTDRLSLNNVFGEPLSTIRAVWGDNLMDWRIKPFGSARTGWQGTRSQYFNHLISQYFEMTQGLIQNDVRSWGQGHGTFALPNAAPNAQVGSQWNQGVSALATFERGTGWVTINGEPQAVGGNRLVISGAREGVDGNYSIDEAHHHYSRNGYVTRCKLWLPREGGPA